MRVAEVRTHLLEHRLPAVFESATMRFDRRTDLLVEVVCDDGTVGWGECLGPARRNAAVVAAYAPWLVGQDLLETQVVWTRLYDALRDQAQPGLTVTALSGIDVALWATAVQIAAALQFLGVLPPEAGRHEPRAPILEFDRTPNLFRQAFVATPLEHERGSLRIPDGPGLGIEVNRDALREFRARDD